MLSGQREAWIELNRALIEVEQNMFSLGGRGSAIKKIKASRDALQSFNSTAASLGLAEFERAGKALEDYLTREIEPTGSEEAIAVFGFALNAFVELVENAASADDSSALNAEEVLEILGAISPEAMGEVPVVDRVPPVSAPPVPPTPETKSEVVTSTEGLKETDSFDFSRLQQIVSHLEGELSIHPEDGAPGTFQLCFQADPAVLRRVEILLSSADPSVMVASQLYQEDARTAEVLNTIREFMGAMAAGDVKGARLILLLLAKQQHQAGLYDEIGTITRDLHDSLKSFVDSLDTALKGLVEDELASSENRLERILKHTEKAANTTLDHVEAMQRRNRDDLVRTAQLKLLLGRFKVAGKAQERMAVIKDLLDELNKSMQETRDDLVKVLTAQDYQDLTGQVIMRIMELLKDLELKLVKVISTFGFKVEYLTEKRSETTEKSAALRGREGILDSQDDVDDLLAQFGF
jgi:chemotaxis protein CheZ